MALDDGPAGGQRGGDWVAALITLMVAEIVEGSIMLVSLVGRDGPALAGAGDRDVQPVEAG